MRSDTPSKEFIESHNRAQQSYFDTTLKPTMIPIESPYVQRQVREMVAFTGLAPDQRILEIGCGMGRYTIPLAKQGLRVEGLDLSAGQLERLRVFDGGRYGIALYQADVSDPPPQLIGRFDAAIGFFALHHFHDLERCFRAMANLVRPGGIIAFLEPNAWNPLYYLQIALSPGITWQGDGGIIEMRRAKVFPAMSAAGLVDLRLERFGFFPPFLTNRRAGAAVERALERFPPFRPILPFQLFGGRRPLETREARSG